MPDAPHTDALLTAQELAFSYGERRVLDNVSLTLPPRQLTTIVGPNGCGKSTLLRVLLGQIEPHQGAVCLGGRPLPSLRRRELAAHMALVPQNTSAPFDFSAREMVLMARYHRHAGMLPRFETPDDLRAADTSMWAMDVHHLADRPITTLSGGERQRVMIARALCQNTPILLLDEPTSALDLHHQFELFEQLRTLVTRGVAVAMVTHDLNTARHISSRTLVMDNGKIVAHGPPSDVLVPQVLEPVYRVRVETRGDMLMFHRQATTTPPDTPGQ